jgi:hypothetical protein
VGGCDSNRSTRNVYRKPTKLGTPFPVFSISGGSSEILFIQDRSFHGGSVNQDFIFSPDFKFNYDFTPKIAGGLKYYGSVGPITGFDTVAQQQQIFRAIDLNIIPQWDINFGLSVGFTGSTGSPDRQNDSRLSL